MFTEKVTLEIIGAVVILGSLALNLFINKKVNATHKLINSRMDEMLVLTKGKAEAEGNLKGREEQKAETKVDASVAAQQPIELKIPSLVVELKSPTPTEPTDPKTKPPKGKT